MKYFIWFQKYEISLLRTLIYGLLISIIVIISFLVVGYVGASKPLSYLPEFELNDLRSPESQSKVILENSKIKLFIGEDGELKVLTNNDEEIISDLIYYSSCVGADEKWKLDSVSVNVKSDSTVLIRGLGQFNAEVSMLLTVPKMKQELNISVITEYKIITIVNRESLIVSFDVPVNNVYLKNRQVETKSFNNEYWLQQQGAQMGTGTRSALIYKPSNVSSLQLDAKRDLLFVNLDFYLDHPFYNIPFQLASGGRWVDKSTSEYLPGDKRENNFTIYFGELTKNIPRIMLVPDGYLAGYIFTEHADGGTLRTNRASYFGSEDITDISKATSGFAAHKIPVTKSIFYANPDNAPYCSVKTDPEFLEFLDQLNGTGLYEICLHTPENLNSDRQMMEESIKFMKERFETETWIDHGMFSGKLNRETMVADGLNPNSEYYSADLWEKYNTRYFWSSAVEDLRKFSIKEKLIKMKFYQASMNLFRLYLTPQELMHEPFYMAFVYLQRVYLGRDEINSLMPGKGEAFPTPLYWKHPTRTRNFYSWPTEYFKKYEDLSDETVSDENKQLNNLIKNWGVFINHGYFVRNLKNVDVTTESEGKLVINPYFDKILKDMSLMREDRNLYISTVKDLMNYWILTENISFDFLPNGSIDVYNNNDKAIPGLSMAVRKTEILVDGKSPKQREVDSEIIFWFDIPSRGNVTLTFPKVLL